MTWCSACRTEKDPEDFSRRTAPVRGEERQAWCKECFRIYDGTYLRPNAASGDGRAYVPIGKIEIKEGFARKDALRRVGLLRGLLTVMALLLVACNARPYPVVACHVECSAQRLTEAQRRIGEEAFTCSGTDVTVKVVCR